MSSICREQVSRSWSTWRSVLRKSSPAAVRRRGFTVRSTSSAPASVSSRSRNCESEGCEMLRDCAALEKLPSVRRAVR